MRNANNDRKNLRDHFKKSDAVQKQLGKDLAGKPLPKPQKRKLK